MQFSRSLSHLFLCGALLCAEETNKLLPPAGETPTAARPDPRLDGTAVPTFPSREYFRYIFGNPDTRIELQQPVRLDELVVGDHIEMNLRQYLELVLANNTDIQLTKLNIEQPKNAILRGYSLFDPIVVAGFNTTRQYRAVFDRLQGVADTLTTLNQPLTLGLRQVLPTGTVINGNYSATKFSTNSVNAVLNPLLSSDMGFGFSQPLLRNRGRYITRLPITIARARLQGAEFDVSDTIQRAVADAENAYWNVVSARENLRVQEQALGFADAALKRAKRELELGAASPLDIFQPEQNYATIEVQVSQARFAVQQALDNLRRQIAVDLNPQLRDLPITLTEPVQTILTDRTYDREELVTRAMRLRPDLRSNRQALQVDDLQLSLTRNRMLPALALTGQYGIFGRGGPSFSNFGRVGGGFTDAIGQMFGFGNPTYGFGLTLQLPLRDRAAAADFADAQVQKKQDLYRVRSLEQQVRNEVVNAITQVENSRAAVKLANVALDFAKKRLDAEQKKYDLGTTTIFFLLAAQNDLTVAQANLVNQQIQFRRNLLSLDLRTGELLQQRNLVIQ